MMNTTLLNPTINRPDPWWSHPNNRSALLKLAEDHFAATEITNPGTVGLYVHSRQVLQQRLDSIKNLKSIGKVFYATKANNNAEIIKMFLESDAGIECVSFNELKMVLGMYPELDGARLLFTPNFASKQEFIAVKAFFSNDARRAALSAGAITQLYPFITIDNMWVLENWQFDHIFADVRLFLRVDPGNDGYGHHSHVSTGASSKFGITQEDLATFFTTEKGKSIAPHIAGLHMHKGSGVNSSDEWAKTATTLTQYLQYFPNLTHLDLGGGLGIPYQPTQTAFDLASLDTALYEVRNKFPQLTFCVEPGRYLVAESGVLLCKVNQLKTKNTYHFVGVSAGMNTLLRPALYGAYHHIVNLSKYDPMYLQQAAEGVTVQQNKELGLSFAQSDNAHHVVVDVVGPICETGDFLGKNRVFPQTTDEGDIILVDAAGAYGKAMSNSYNLRAPEVTDVVADFE